MRRKLVLGLGLTGLLTGSAAGQFGSPAAPPPAPAPFGGGTPVGTPSVPVLPAPAIPGSYVPPVGGVTPTPAPMNTFRPMGTPGAVQTVAPVEIASALGPNHPLALKPEDGTYFICVKSYSRPHNPDADDRGYTVKQLGEMLADDIHKNHQCRVFLYEQISDEKMAEVKARTAARQRAAEYSTTMLALKQKSELQGMEFLDFDQKIKFQTFHYRDQVAVLLGGYRTEEEAVKALKVVKTWREPQNTSLMDGVSIATKTTKGGIEHDKRFVNPFASAMIVQNPMVTKQLVNNASAFDPFITKLNEGRPYNLLMTTKSWTLAVKSFAAPVHYTSKDDDTSMMKKFGMSKGADVLQAGMSQAEALAKALREMRAKDGTPMNLEAYVLHTRMASMVTVGQYDSPNDPALLENQRILSRLTFNLSKDDKGQQITGTGERMFADAIMPVPIPKH